jgi:hypothetical protein
MKVSLIVSILGLSLASNLFSEEIYFEGPIITINGNSPDKPGVSTGNQKYRIDKNRLYITRSDGTEYFYNFIEKTNQKLRFTCGNKILIYKDYSKTDLILSHFDEIETKIIYLKKG